MSELISHRVEVSFDIPKDEIADVEAYIHSIKRSKPDWIITIQSEDEL